jgi:hypothetical protein
MFQKELDNLRKAFWKFRRAQLKLNPVKCHLFQKEVWYLGHVISLEGVSTCPEKLKVEWGWPPPMDKHKLKSFFGLCTYYRRFIVGLADIAKPLTQFTEEKCTSFQWSPEAEAAFQCIKGSLCTAPDLRYPQPSGKFIVDTDENSVEIGGVLSQLQDALE